MKILLLPCLAITLLPSQVRGDAAPIDKVVHIYFTKSSEEFMKTYATEEGSVPKDKKKEAVDAIIKMTKDSQQEVVQAIEAHSTKYKYESFWVVNMISLNETDSELLEKITEMSSVKSVELIDRPVPNYMEGDEALKEPEGESRQSGARWHIQQLNVPEVWKSGINGSGVVVGTLHRGAFAPHTILRPSYRGDGQYGFYEPGSADDASSGNIKDCAHEHGLTHISTGRVGMAVGQNGYGVAPGAKFMACSCVERIESFLDCLTWLICPHNGGTSNGDPDCSKSPAAVAVSSTYGGLNVSPAMMIQGVTMLITMGITVITEAGRIEGNPCRQISPGCTVESSICVGFTNADGKRSKFSACGPGPLNSTKPDIVVPGYGIESPDSCVIGCIRDNAVGDCTYMEIGATSGSGHALGIVALMYQKNPRLTPARVRKILIDSGKLIEDEEYQCCGDLDEKNHPNYCIGYGLVDAKKAVDSA